MGESTGVTEDIEDDAVQSMRELGDMVVPHPLPDVYSELDDIGRQGLIVDDAFGKERAAVDGPVFLTLLRSIEYALLRGWVIDDLPLKKDGVWAGPVELVEDVWQAANPDTEFGKSMMACIREGHTRTPRKVWTGRKRTGPSDAGWEHPPFGHDPMYTQSAWCVNLWGVPASATVSCVLLLDCACNQQQKKDVVTMAEREEAQHVFVVHRKAVEGRGPRLPSMSNATWSVERKSVRVTHMTGHGAASMNVVIHKMVPLHAFFALDDPWCDDFQRRFRTLKTGTTSVHEPIVCAYDAPPTGVMMLYARRTGDVSASLVVSHSSSNPSSRAKKKTAGGNVTSGR
jgi:hypothetical protein